MKPLPPLFVAGMVLAAIIPVVSAQRSVLSDETTFSVKDEEYFLIRALETLYEQWPQVGADPDAFTAASLELRQQAIRLRTRAQQINAASALVTGYQDFVDLIDDFTGFLTDLNIIRNTTEDVAKKDAVGSGLRGGGAAVSTYSQVSQWDDMSTPGAVGLSLLAGGITYGLDAWTKGHRRQEAEDAAVARAAQKLSDTFFGTLEQTRQAFLGLSRQRGWRESEIGWEISIEQAKAVFAMLSQGDFPGLVRETGRQRSLRPRDPFIRCGHNLFHAIQQETDPNALTRIAEDSYESTKLIPPGSVYIYYRVGALTNAALIASMAREAERLRGNTDYSTDLSKRSLALWREAYRLEPRDTTGGIRYGLAIAKLADGDVNGARELAGSISHFFENDPHFVYLCACILSRSIDLEGALGLLRAALQSGAIDIHEVRKDSDLRPLRVGVKKKEFAQLVTPQWSWTVTDDWLWDDVILQNNSAFPLTGVTFTVYLRNGARQERLKLKCDCLLPGQQYKWEDVVSGAEGHWDKTSRTELSCDQSPK